MWDEDFDFEGGLDPRNPDDFLVDLTTTVKTISFDIWRDYSKKELDLLATLIDQEKLDEDQATQLLLMHFFPRFHRMLSHLLSEERHTRPDIAEWYLHWKNTIPEVLLTRGDIKDQLLSALKTMRNALLAPRTKPAYKPPPPKRREIPVPTPDLKRMSIAKWIEILAAQHNIAFAPLSRKRHESKQLYMFGDERIYFLDSVVYLWDPVKKTYSPVSPVGLVNRCV
ncbi:hypothetical protein L596_030392 [Steinernema carpocapsae]|uniref:GCF C-terminal domain-containing protein n=1 Tax=Steinernema carpocapsae TaxID=34508 RepID=A0A4U5LPB1_STECR|nr:hypothetical protein L596_030392 [Steinernema carpocapsae]